MTYIRICGSPANYPYGTLEIVIPDENLSEQGDK